MPKRIISKTSVTPEDKLKDLLAYTDQQGDCKIWRGAVNTDGYAHMLGNLKVHRYVYHLSTGNNPVGMVVRHTCDTPLCLNPEHLILGTPGENMNDKFLRGRQPRVVSVDTVMKVRELLNTTSMKQADIGKLFGIDARRVSDINCGRYNEDGKTVIMFKGI